MCTHPRPDFLTAALRDINLLRDFVKEEVSIFWFSLPRWNGFGFDVWHDRKRY